MDKTAFKENIKKYYNTEADLRNSKSVKSDWKVKARKDFYNLIKQENKETLLELGAGAGYDSQFFMNGGLTVTAIDLSIEMVNKCREKFIEAYELDFYNLSSLIKILFGAAEPHQTLAAVGGGLRLRTQSSKSVWDFTRH